MKLKRTKWKTLLMNDLDTSSSDESDNESDNEFDNGLMINLLNLIINFKIKAVF